MNWQLVVDVLALAGWAYVLVTLVRNRRKKRRRAERRPAPTPQERDLQRYEIRDLIRTAMLGTALIGETLILWSVWRWLMNVAEAVSA